MHIIVYIIVIKIQLKVTLLYFNALEFGNFSKKSEILESTVISRL